jgi:hypothetical protein
MSDDFGLTPQAAIRAFAFSSDQAAPAPATPAPPTPAAPLVTPTVQPHSKAGVSNAEAATMAGWIKEDLASGKMTQAQADKAFDDLGTPPEQRVTPADVRSDEVRLLDQHFPAARPEDYQIRYADPGQSPPPMTEMIQFDQSARTWLSGASFQPT